MSASYRPRPVPNLLDDLERLKRRGPARWLDREEELLFEYDALHGHVEGYNVRGRHIGVFDAVTGERIGPAIRGRRIDV